MANRSRLNRDQLRPIGNVAYARQTSQGWPFYNGISWCNSLTAPAKAIAAANIWLTLVLCLTKIGK